MHWQEVAVGYVSYLAVVSMARREFARARLPSYRRGGGSLGRAPRLWTSSAVTSA